MAWGLLSAAWRRRFAPLPLSADRDDGRGAPLPSLADQTPTWASASNLARNLGLDQLGRPLG
jgi:hypothetical protein